MALGDLITIQPLKTIYILFAVAINLLKLPFWLIYFLFNRPHPQWTYSQALKTRIVATAIWHGSFIRQKPAFVLKPQTQKERDHLVAIPPSSKSALYVGVCEDKEVKPERICGYWYPEKFRKDEDGDKDIVLHFHGGAFVIGDCRPNESGFGAKILTKHIGKTLMVGYRLASHPKGRFPAALQDSLSALQYLLDLGIKPSKIILSGDSAGGNIVISLLRYISENKELMGLDLKAALLWSPWVDVAEGLDPKSITESPWEKTDFVSPVFVVWGACAIVGADANEACVTSGARNSSSTSITNPSTTQTSSDSAKTITVTSPWISPKSHPFQTTIPIWIHYGGLEVLQIQIKEFYRGMKGVAGNRVELVEEPMANHDILLVGNLTGFEVEAERMGADAAVFVRGL